MTSLANARLGELFGNAGVNIEGLCGARTGGGQAEIHVLVEDLSPAICALAVGGMEGASEQEVAVYKVEDRPGVMDEMSRKLGTRASASHSSIWATKTRPVFGADDLAAATAALAP